jgi:hypothetical protein
MEVRKNFIAGKWVEDAAVVRDDRYVNAAG